MNSYPILEYDGAPGAVLEPDHEGLGITLPPRVAFPFVDDIVDDYAREHNLPVLAVYDTVTKKYPVYKLSDEVCLCQAPLGAPIAAALMDWMIAYGARQFISTGSCGALIDLPENTFIVPRRALRDEGTSYHYMPASRWSFLDYDLQRRITDTFREKDIAFTECDTWTTDAIFRETVDKVRRCRSEGCGVVDMECAALSAVAEFRNVQFGQFLFVADTLADAEAYDARNWGADSLVPAMMLCIEIAGREA
jgi:uridine phosphorylase